MPAIGVYGMLIYVRAAPARAQLAVVPRRQRNAARRRYNVVRMVRWGPGNRDHSGLTDMAERVRRAARNVVHAAFRLRRGSARAGVENPTAPQDRAGRVTRVVVAKLRAVRGEHVKRSSLRPSQSGVRGLDSTRGQAVE